MSPLGDGDPCPQDPDHGRMYFIGSERKVQWCPNARHKGSARYQYDGKTPAPERKP